MEWRKEGRRKTTTGGEKWTRGDGNGEKRIYCHNLVHNEPIISAIKSRAKVLL